MAIAILARFGKARRAIAQRPFDGTQLTAFPYGNNG
jgi:hypothetical protein